MVDLGPANDWGGREVYAGLLTNVPEIARVWALFPEFPGGFLLRFVLW